MSKKHYGTPTFKWVKLPLMDVIRTSPTGLAEKDVTFGDPYDDGAWAS